MFHINATTAGVLAILASSALAVTNANAATVTATASITDITSSLLSFSNNQYLSDASTPFQNGFDAGSVLQNYWYNNTAHNGDTSFASIDDGFAPLPQTSAGAAHKGQGSSTVLWSFDWTAIGTGTAMLNLEYLYSATVANYAVGEKAMASSRVAVGLDGTQNQQESLHFFYNEDGNTSGFSNLVLNFNVNSGDTGTFTVSTASNAVAEQAPVPLPAAAWLLGSAAVGLLGFARRKV